MRRAALPHSRLRWAAERRHLHVIGCERIREQGLRDPAAFPIELALGNEEMGGKQEEKGRRGNDDGRRVKHGAIDQQ